MTIRAFLGHSFSDDDKVLVNQVTEFLDAQKVSHQDFSWVHATQAKSMGVVEKVLPLIRESDVFIGLCTRKELVAPLDDLTPAWWSRKMLQVEKNKIQWKTSDWIIQEIGIAIQREMPLILLVENGVREPGGLIGDLEYIPFSRANLAPAFTRLTEMLGDALQTSAAGSGVSEPPAQTTASQEKLPRSEEPLVKDDGLPPFSEPNADWNPKDYRHALFNAVIASDKDFEDRVWKAFRDSEYGKEAEATEKLQAFHEYHQILVRRGGNLSRLEALVNRHRSDAEMVRILAQSQVTLGNHDIGAVLFEEAAEASVSDNAAVRQADLLLSAIRAYTAIDSIPDAERVLLRLNGLPGASKEDEKDKLVATSVIAESQKNNEVRIASLERLVALDPSDAETRFALGYLYSETGDFEASLFHYLAIREHDRNHGSWNNLGVARERVKLKFGAVEAYRKSEELGNSLAMSNLAKGFIAAGFAREADALCNAALSMPDYDPKVPATLSLLKEETDSELEREQKIVKKISHRTRFLRDAGHALTLSPPEGLAANWVGPKCKLILNKQHDEIHLSGTYEGRVLGLLYALDKKSASKIYSVTYSGTARGRAFFLEMKITEVGESKTSTLLTGETPSSAVMILSDDGCRLRVMEINGNTETFYDITTTVEL